MISVTVPGYEMIDVLGRGGFGVVYRARQVAIDREVAVKVDSRVILDDRDQRRFLREVRAAGRLSGHPHVVEIYDAGVLPDGHPFLVMELCPGGSLAGRPPLAVPDVAAIGRGIADALAAAHGLGVLHRDIKPANILVKRYGTVGLADFGLAALIETGRDSSVTLAALTPAYAAPEAFHLQPPSPRSDIYALGATLYALLAGRPPRFPAGADLSVPQIIRLHDAPVPDLPGVPPELTGMLRRALAKDPAWRYPDAAAFRDDLARWTGPASARSVTAPVLPPQIPQQAPPPAVSMDPRGAPNPARRATMLTGAALAVVVALLAVWFFLVRDDPQGQNGGTAAPDGSAAPTAGSTAAPDPVESFGIETVVDGCPAAGVPGGQARCAKRAECWSGITVIQGVLTSIRELPCEQEHAYETYAIALVPPDVADPYLDVLEANATVAKVCAKEILLASRFGDAVNIPTDQWEPQVLPPTPDDREERRNVYRCVGTLEGPSSQGAAFRPIG